MMLNLSSSYVRLSVNEAIFEAIAYIDQIPLHELITVPTYCHSTSSELDRGSNFVKFLRGLGYCSPQSDHKITYYHGSSKIVFEPRPNAEENFIPAILIWQEDPIDFRRVPSIYPGGIVYLIVSMINDESCLVRIIVNANLLPNKPLVIMLFNIRQSVRYSME